MSDLLRMLSANEIIAQVISFLILLFLLRAFAWKKVLKLLDDRKEKISLELQEIEEAKQEITGLKADYEAKLSSIEQVTAAKIQEAIAEGKMVQEEIRKRANENAQEIIENAKKNIKYELAQAKEELKNDIIDLTIGATEHIIREKLTGEDDKKLINEFLQTLDEEK
jgi:F-type H+-transporting ATPase subunit b